ncbi:cerebellin 11 [Pholidichthys leucotaenia]
MEVKTLVFLIFMGCLFVEPGFGQESDGENGLAALETWLTATKVELSRQVIEMEKLRKENEALSTRLDVAEQEIDRLKLNTAPPQIAFSVSLSNSGQINKDSSTDKTLVFKRVFSNIGNGYDVNTGIFTAPVNGLYHFTFSTYGSNSRITGAILKKNNVQQISTYEAPSGDGATSNGNAAILQLAADDKVHVEMWENAWVYDDLNGLTTFSGFLLFPVFNK